MIAHGWDDVFLDLDPERGLKAGERWQEALKRAAERCELGLNPKTSVGHSARQVFDLPKPQPLVVTEHRAHDCECTACGAKTRALFPESVNAPVQYGARITAFIIYLLHYQLLPENRLATLTADLFGVKVATATIARAGLAPNVFMVFSRRCVISWPARR